MTNYLLLIISFCLITLSTNAQFINLQIKIEPELTATVEQDLNFGQIVISSGRSEIQLGDVNMGIFQIRAFYTQNIFLNFNVPETLTHANPSIEDSIPIHLNIAFNNTGTGSYNNSVTLEQNTGYIPIHNNLFLNAQEASEIWQEMLLYVYGYIDVGDIAAGEYSSEIILEIEYD